MGSMLRSDPMTMCDVYLQPEEAFEILSQIGEADCVQFYDMNEGVQSFQRKFITEVCRCAEMERRLRYMEDEMSKDNIYVPTLHKDPPTLRPSEMRYFENIIEKWESDIMEMAANQVNLMKNYLELTELHCVLANIGPMLGTADLRREAMLSNDAFASAVGKRRGPRALRLLDRSYHPRGGKGADIESSGRLAIMTGLVQRQKSFSFEMMLWRLSHGNVYYRPAAEDKILKDPYTGVDIRKVPFLAIGQGEQLKSRMEKVCNGFRVNLYPCPTSHSERTTMLKKLEISLKDLESVLRSTKFHRCKALRTVGRQWPGWMVQVRKAKAIYHTMNLFSLDITKKVLIGRCWVPTADLPRVQEILAVCSRQMETTVPSFMSKVDTHETPPTFHRTNRFTHGFQALINAYGDSCYRELNPGLYTIITFPFLFSLMFGDIGHGFIMFMFAAWMLKNEKRFMEEKSKNEIWNIFFGGRYIILLMSVFSLYAGLIYNDLFSKGMSFTTSGWSYMPFTDEDLGQEHLLLAVKDYGNTYPVGMDPAWKLGENKILFENSLKMKLSIVIGVIHMIFGLSLSFFNHLYFKKRYLIFFEFIPQMLFLCCIFFWLVILIFLKWFQYGGKTDDVKTGAGCAPLILILFIDMVLFTTSKPVEPTCDAYMFSMQQLIQSVLVLVSVASVPIMLFGPPMFASWLNKKKKIKLQADFRKYKMSLDEDLQDEEDAKAKWFKKELEKASEPFADLMIHQAVHTIEFVLSTISHTASYLRLWALSLAHAQLSEMLWMMVFSKMALQDVSWAGAPKIVVVFAIWAMFSLSILVLMEGLSAFLHTLRLHWVEFMSKFYGGCGYVFRPFSFRSILTDSVKDKQEVCVTKRKTEY